MLALYIENKLPCKYTKCQLNSRTLLNKSKISIYAKTRAKNTSREYYGMLLIYWWSIMSRNCIKFNAGQISDTSLYP